MKNGRIKVSKYGIALFMIGALAMILLLCQPVDGLSDWEFLGVLAVTKLAGAALVWLLIKLAAKWTAEGKINLGVDHDTELS